MTAKLQQRIKYAMYAVLLLAALLLDTAVFTALNLRYVPTVMPVAVSCIGLWEGAERGSIFGLAGGLLWAWSSALSLYGAWCIVIMTIVGMAAGMFSERMLLQGWNTILCVSAAALFLTDGVYTILMAANGTVAASAFLKVFLPEAVISLLFIVFFYPASEYISRIGGFHG